MINDLYYSQSTAMSPLRCHRYSKAYLSLPWVGEGPVRRMRLTGGGAGGCLWGWVPSPCYHLIHRDIVDRGGEVVEQLERETEAEPVGTGELGQEAVVVAAAMT